MYSQDDKLGDAANNIATTGNTNFCDTIGAAACTFTVTSRTGTVGLVAALYDHDTKGTASPADDTFTLIGWATRTGITVANGVAQSGQDLTIVAATDLATITADFGTPPSGLPTVAAVVGIDAGTSGTLQLFSVLTPASPSLLAPKLSAISGSTYRLTGIANNGTGPTAAQSVVLRRPLTTAPLAAGTWLAAPTGLALTRTGGSWTAVAGALVMGASYDQTVATTVTHLLNVTAFDSSTTYVIPDVVTLPAGTLDAKGTAIGATLDPMNFSADADRGKLNSFASQPVAVN